jgi:hypothetical protein
MAVAINFVLFQLAWFACVLGAAYQMPWIGPLAVAAIVGYHLLRVPEPRAEIALLVIVALIGAVFDSVLVSTGWLAYPSGQWAAYLAPYWIVAMWVAFATTFNVSLNWLKGRPLLGFAFGAVGGPLAFVAGEKLGGVTLVEPVAALAALAIGWGLITPVLMALAARFDGWRPGVGRRVLATAGGSGSV